MNRKMVVVIGIIAITAFSITVLITYSRQFGAPDNTSFGLTCSRLEQIINDNLSKARSHADAAVSASTESAISQAYSQIAQSYIQIYEWKQCHGNSTL